MSAKRTEKRQGRTQCALALMAFAALRHGEAQGPCAAGPRSSWRDWHFEADLIPA